MRGVHEVLKKNISFSIISIRTIIIITTALSSSVIDYVHSCYQQLVFYIICSTCLSFISFLLTSIVSQPNTDYLLARFVFVD